MNSPALNSGIGHHRAKRETSTWAGPDPALLRLCPRCNSADWEGLTTWSQV